MTFKLEIVRDGNQVGVWLGRNLTEGFAGFGLDLPSALESLALDLRSEPGEHQTAERSELRRRLDLAANQNIQPVKLQLVQKPPVPRPQG